VACAADPAKAATFQPDCERIASTLTLNGATAYQLGVPKAYSAKLNSTLSRMQAQRDAALSRLRSAKAPAGQASAARQAAAAYGAAARSLSSGVPPQVSGANAKIVAALHQSQRGYLQMAAGALSGDRGRYASGKAQVAKGDAALAKALEALKSSPS
jgi:uncharacterized protein YjbJ (UPF0337 family)